MSAAATPSACVQDRRSLVGYALVGGSFAITGLLGTLLEWATAPESALLVLRFVVAGLALTLVFARRRPLTNVWRQGVAIRVLSMGAIDATSTLMLFVAMRANGVAIGMFLQFLAPVWVAAVAPRILGARTDRVVYPALVLALGGLAVILGPSLSDENAALSWPGVLAGLTAGLGYAAFQLTVKDLTRRIASASIVIMQVWIDALLLLPLALWQTVGAGYRLTSRDVIAGAILGLACTALAYTMWTEGTKRIRLQHSSILGYLEPVTAPVYALLLLGQTISTWTILGGALILLAGALILVWGERESQNPHSMMPHQRPT